MDGLEANMRDLAGALTTIGEKVDRLADLTLEMQRVSTATAEAIVVSTVRQMRQSRRYHSGERVERFNFHFAVRVWYETSTNNSMLYFVLHSFFSVQHNKVYRWL